MIALNKGRRIQRACKATNEKQTEHSISRLFLTKWEEDKANNKVVFISKNILEFYMNQLFKISVLALFSYLTMKYWTGQQDWRKTTASYLKTIENVKYYTPTVSRWWELNWTHSDTSQSPGTGSPRRRPESRPARCCTAGSGGSSDGCSQHRGAAFYRRDSELRRSRQTPCWRFQTRLPCLSRLSTFKFCRLRELRTLFLC